MRIWWCQEHNEHAATKAGGDQWCWRANFTPSLKPCRMVPGWFIPDNAETVDRETLTAALGSTDPWNDWTERQLGLVSDAARAWLALDGMP